MTGIKLLRLEKVVDQAAAMVLPGRKTKSRVSENLVKKESVRTAVSNEFCVTSYGQPSFPIDYTNVNNRQWSQGCRAGGNPVLYQRMGSRLRGEAPLTLKNTSHLGQKDARDKRAWGNDGDKPTQTCLDERES